jgi:hypothetical protein
VKRALVIGINEYRNANKLNGCINDAKSIEALIARNSDGTKNFDTKMVTSEDGEVLAKQLRKHIAELFFAACRHGISIFLGTWHGDQPWWLSLYL